MKQIIVLGSGCSKCRKTAELLAKVAQQLQIEADIKKETDPATLLKYRVMRTPAIVIDEQVVHAGSIPTTHQVEQWLSS